MGAAAVSPDGPADMLLEQLCSPMGSLLGLLASPVGLPRSPVGFWTQSLLVAALATDPDGLMMG